MFVGYESDIFTSKAQAIVNPINLVGVMGAGLAKAFKERYPDMYKDYRRRFESNLLKQAYAYRAGSGRIIVNFPTKRHWKDKSSKALIDESLKWLYRNYKQLGIKSICFPKVGCGLGGLDWSEVKPALMKFASMVDMQVYIVE